MNSSELETLFKIMETISSDKNWRLSYPNPCQTGLSWPGIECKPGNDSHLHVTRLDFGTPPNPTCKATAMFPSQLFDLPFLQSLFIFHCFTHTKTTLSVSGNRVVVSSSLQQLSFRSNPALIGSIPPQISSLKSLQILTLSQNRLSGQIPVEVFAISSLVHLDLSYNLLTGTIPNQVGSLRNLVGLDLSYNSLSGAIPSTIGQLGMLQKLDLSSNSLFGGIPESIERLNSLFFLALSNNRLKGNFPKGLEKLQGLQYFIMDDNPMFVSLPAEFGQLQKLQELRLANSGYSGTIPPAFSQLKNLSTLSLQNNRLTGEIPAGFGGLLHIYHLNLSRNFLGGVVPFNSSFMNRLGANLDLSGNPGLCLSPSEAEIVKFGITVCGKNRTGSLIHPVKKSEAPCGLLRSFLIFGALGFMALQHLLRSSV
ncbi:hypothetical protein RHGRI_017366 [Rhododendron griersonianum]|uniref:Uncharacterized protein n=1 Tax=Rhododendron griersonianum TaxID=479676 RepID=A0AAV6JXH9_9ERIC|nr:hypothetical protein RHGRI_017366 [Rhododendron griersonianum]